MAVPGLSAHHGLIYSLYPAHPRPPPMLFGSPPRGDRDGGGRGGEGGRHTHVQATGDASALEGLLSGVLLTGLDKARHFLLGQLNLASAKGREVDVCNLELRCWFTHLCGIVTG